VKSPGEGRGSLAATAEGAASPCRCRGRVLEAGEAGARTD
jgi:hypothetical protein